MSRTILVNVVGHTFQVNTSAKVLENEKSYECLDNSQLGKDNKPKKCMCSFIDLSVMLDNEFMLVYLAQGYKQLVQVNNTSNILDYNLIYIPCFAKNDLFQGVLNTQMRDNGFAILLQSSGAKDSISNESLTLTQQVKLNKHFVVLYLKPSNINDTFNRISGKKYTHDEFIKVATEQQKAVYKAICDAKRQGK